MRCAALLFLAATSACSASPAQEASASLVSDPPGWKRVGFVAGMSLAVPAEARVAYPAGIDSNIMEVRGAGFSLNLDDYGAFDGPGAGRIGGRRATLERAGTPACRRLSYEIELPEPSNEIRRCDRSGNCAPAPGNAQIHALCRSDEACRTVERIAASLRFAPRPYPAMPPRDSNYEPAPPICRAAG